MKKISLLIITLVLLAQISLGQESYIDSTKIKNPKLAWKLSILPGFGQIYNGKYVKAAVLMLGESYAIHQFQHYRHEGSIGKRNTYAWWVMGLMVYSMLDAYVDAQLSTFPVKTEPKEVEKPESPPFDNKKTQPESGSK